MSEFSEGLIEASRFVFEEDPQVAERVKRILGDVAQLEEWGRGTDRILQFRASVALATVRYRVEEAADRHFEDAS